MNEYSINVCVPTPKYPRGEHLFRTEWVPMPLDRARKIAKSLAIIYGPAFVSLSERQLPTSHDVTY